MKKIFPTLLLILTLSACSPQQSEILFDETVQGILKVILQDYNDGTIHYDAIGPDGQRQETQEFESLPIEIYTLPRDCIEYIPGDRPNKLATPKLTDANGNSIEIDKTLQRILDLLCQNEEHWLLNLRILKQGEHYFVNHELNVNLWWPSIVSYYDPAQDILIELYTYDATKVIGLIPINLPAKQ